MHAEIETLVRSKRLREAVSVLRSTAPPKAKDYLDDAILVGRTVAIVNGVVAPEEDVMFMVQFLLQYGGLRAIEEIHELLRVLPGKTLDSVEFREQAALRLIELIREVA